MIKRIVEIGNPARLSLERRQLKVEKQDAEPVTLPVEDLGVLILDHPAIRPSQGLLSACLDNNVAVVLCNAKHLPVSVLLPLDGNTLHSKILREQVAMTEGLGRRLWRRIIRAKILAQAKTLDECGVSSRRLQAMAEQVRGDNAANMEAQAARLYWQHLFGTDFRRRPDEGGINSLLNYGYALVRAATARSIVATGLHPALGLHHSNQYNAFCLADDLVEPLRPVVDLKVHEMWKTMEDNQDSSGLGKEEKRALMSVLSRSVTIGKVRLPLQTALHYYAASVRKAISGEAKELEIPKI